ncbi:MAG: CDP-glycerol glycerophosphotransferase family protein [Candidatus Lokiarchaeota archaeon]
MRRDELLNKLKYVKSTNLYQFFQEIIYSSVIKFISRLYRDDIDDNFIILSTYGGKAFIDNTKYLFLYLNKIRKYKTAIITSSEELSNELNSKGYKVIPKFSLRSIRILRRAKFIFTTHGIFDVLPIDFSPNTTFVCTWHGVQNKRNKTVHGPIKYFKLARYCKLKTVNEDYMDYFVTTSGTEKDIKLIMNYFLISRNKILTTGYPRNDILFNDDRAFKALLRNKYQIAENVNTIILYAPTFRDKVFTAKFPLSKSQLVKLNTILKQTNSILIMKAHMFEKFINFKEYTHIKKAPQNADIQELLNLTNTLITDYSSVYCDFLLLDRPILFFTYDFEDFIRLLKTLNII